MRRHVNTDKAPAAIGTYSQAVFAGDTLYLSGQLGLDPATMTLPAEFAAQCERVFANLKSVVEAAGASLDQVVKLTVFSHRSVLFCHRQRGDGALLHRALSCTLGGWR